VKLISESDLAHIEAHLAARLDRLLNADGLATMNAVIRAYVLAGGKRVRPQLCLWTYRRVGGSGLRVQGSGFRSQASGPHATLENTYSAQAASIAESPNPEPLLDAACAWELFHAFLLAHDDIIDSAQTRREQAALHRQLAALDHNSPKFGTDLAIVAGDLLFSAAMRLWHELEVPPEQYRALLKLFSRVASITGFGQAIDICQSQVPIGEVNEETLLREYHWKTAAYTFEGPMLSGAILAGADADTQAAISRYALSLGQAYQMQNDLIDLSAGAHEGCDLVQGKRTITLIAARNQLSAAQREAFDGKLEVLRTANGHALQYADEIRRELLVGGAAGRTRERIEKFLQEARAAASSRTVPDALQQGMNSLLDALQKQYFVAV